MAGAEATTERWVEAQAWIRFGVLSVKWGKSGWPDRLFLIPGGRPFLIEFKAPGEGPEPRQAYRHKVLKTLGYDVEVHDDRDQALTAIEQRVKQHYDHTHPAKNVQAARSHQAAKKAAQRKT